MTPEEAHAIATVISHVDGGCGSCVHTAFRELIELLPETDWAAIAAQVEFPDDIEYQAEYARNLRWSAAGYPLPAPA